MLMMSQRPAMDERALRESIPTCDQQHRVTSEETENEDERKRWVEQVEEAERRTADLLWQHWDRGQTVFQPLVSTAKTRKPSETKCVVTDARAPRALENSVSSEVTNEMLTLNMDPDLLSPCGSGDGQDDFCHMDIKDDCGFWTVGGQHIAELGLSCLESPSTHQSSDRVALDGSSKTDNEHCTLRDDVEGMIVTSCSADGVYESFGTNQEDASCSAKMQEMDLDPFLCPDLGDLSDIDDYLNEDVDQLLMSILEGGLLFEELDNINDVSMPTPPSSPDRCQQTTTETPRRTTHNRRRRPCVLHSEESDDENMPLKEKRQKESGYQNDKEVDEVLATATSDSGAETEPSPADVGDAPTPPPRIVHLHPSIHFITVPDTPGCQVVQTMRLSPPLFTLPTSPTYILVPAPLSPCSGQVPPLSPVDGTVAPVHMSSSPPGSLSDTASKSLSIPVDSPPSPSIETMTCKESPLPQSPSILDLPQSVKDYIQSAKAYTSQTCQEMEPGLSMASHYVDMRVVQRESLHSGRNTNKCLNKELVVMGYTERLNSSLECSQIFESLNGEKPKRYILLFGNTGIGKSTLIKKLCLDWSRDCIPQFDFVFLLDGKELCLTKLTFSLQTLLLNLSSIAPSCMDPESVYNQVLANPKRVLIIFDGFEDLREYELLLQMPEKHLVTSLLNDSKVQMYTVRQLYIGILQRILLPGCTLLLSTRPKGPAGLLLRRADRLLEVCGFTHMDIETYFSQYFTDPSIRSSAMDCLKDCSYLHCLCWNPVFCQMVCTVIGQSKCTGVLPKTLTGFCHQVLLMKIKAECQSTKTVDKDLSQTPMSQEEETHQNKMKALRQKRRVWKVREKSEAEVEGDEAGGIKETQLLSKLSSLAWAGVKRNTSILPAGSVVPDRVKRFGLRTGIFLTHRLRARQEGVGVKRKDTEEMVTTHEGSENSPSNDILFWASPFFQSYLAGVHLSLSRTISHRNFLQTLSQNSGQKGSHRPHRKELELTHRFAVGLLFHDRAEQRTLYTDTCISDMVAAKQVSVIKHLQGLSHCDLSPTQVLEACHYVYEASIMDSDSVQLVNHLAENLPETLMFRGLPLSPPDVLAVQNVLERGNAAGRRFSLDLEDSGIQISGLKALMGLGNINTYRACIADVITLWEELDKNGEQGLLVEAVSKFKINPLKATRVCHIDYLAKLVKIHLSRRLSDSQSHSVLSEGLPAVTELHKLEFELGPEKGPLALLTLWELLPGLHNLQHLDLENNKVGDKGVEELAESFMLLRSLEILNLSQNCIGDKGVKTLTSALTTASRLHCLSLCSNVISDDGALSLAAVLPCMTSLTDLDVTFNRLTDVGAQHLGASLKNCPQMKSLRMWNQCIPYGVYERLQQQDHRIL
ncbi:MHC class II transactivator isoform X2 [Thalassophryne amazonica]|uniref:MHC class II transactivator isoform X2 n=1 Tax=Thalassophryne amazonica TaxID=390379 RepID=UPI001470DCB6|nr:MHC class II transactivator isoform X2 [Thalassophryne amazonica]